MAEHIEASYREGIGDARDGDLVMVEVADGSIKAGIKGTDNREPCVTVLANEILRPTTGETYPGPFTLFGGDGGCLVLGRSFVLDFDLGTVAFPRDWALGVLMVDGAGSFICAHSRKGRSLVNVNDGSLTTARPAAAFADWSLGLRRLDGTIETLYRHKPS